MRRFHSTAPVLHQLNSFDRREDFMAPVAHARVRNAT
jgi:hypothetical protein